MEKSFWSFSCRGATLDGQLDGRPVNLNRLKVDGPESGGSLVIVGSLLIESGRSKRGNLGGPENFIGNDIFK